MRQYNRAIDGDEPRKENVKEIRHVQQTASADAVERTTRTNVYAALIDTSITIS